MSNLSIRIKQVISQIQQFPAHAKPYVGQYSIIVQSTLESGHVREYLLSAISKRYSLLHNLQLKKFPEAIISLFLTIDKRNAPELCGGRGISGKILGGMVNSISLILLLVASQFK
jgi:hypothetical protein